MSFLYKIVQYLVYHNQHPKGTQYELLPFLARDMKLIEEGKNLKLPE